MPKRSLTLRFEKEKEMDAVTYDVERARAAARGMNDPFFADNDVGFRLVREKV